MLATSELLSELKTLSGNVKKFFAHLNAEQLNWQPATQKWSIAQCLDHLVVSNSLYFSTFDDLLANRKKSTLMEQMPFLPNIFGNMLIKAMQDNTKKFKTQSVFKPSQSEINSNIVAQFIDHQEKLMGYLNKLENVDKNIVITSPAASFVVYRLSHLYQLLLVHEKRHFQQAIRVMQDNRFPQNNNFASTIS